MKLIVFFLLLVLFTLSFSISAQTTLTSGEMGVFSPTNQAASPTETENYFAIASTKTGLQAYTTNYPTRIEPLLSFFSNRPVSGAKYNFTLMQETRGDILFPTGGSQYALLSHPDQPLSTQFEISFADFRTPRFTKTSSATIDVIVPITMTGRVSNVGPAGQLIYSIPVNGTGNARLRFKRGAIWNRAYVVNALYRFGLSAP